MLNAQFQFHAYDNKKSVTGKQQNSHSEATWAIFITPPNLMTIKELAKIIEVLGFDERRLYIILFNTVTGCAQDADI